MRFVVFVIFTWDCIRGDDMTAFINRFIPDNQRYEYIDDIESYQSASALANFNNRKLSAKDCADYCRMIFANHNSQAVYKSEKDAIEPFIKSQGLPMPKSTTGWLPEKMRLTCADWWKRQIKKRNVREGEQVRIKNDRVKKYCSDELLKIRKDRILSLKDWIDRTTIENSDGEKLLLKEVVDSSLSNPILMRNELMTRIKGLEQYASVFGHSGRFITPTAYSKCHKSKGELWNGFTPKQVQEYMTKTWSKVRAELARKSINIYGIRVTEPHKDACPHWHLLAWFESSKQAKIGIKIIRDYFLETDGDEKGAVVNRVKTKTINPAKGGASAYVAKYICKNVDGQHIDVMTDRDGEAVTDGADGAARVKAWAGCWGARQFQFFGCPPIGVWRELRRIRKAEEVPNHLFLLWHCADEGDYFCFMVAFKVMRQQGFEPKIKRHSFVDDLAMLAEKFGGVQSIPDDEILKLKTLNCYGEPTGRVVGIQTDSVCLKTRDLDKWTVKTEKKPEQIAEREQLDIYATARFYVGGESNEVWGDIVDFAALSGAFGGVPKGATLSDLWQ